MSKILMAIIVYWNFNHMLKFDMGYFVWVKAPVFDVNNHASFWKNSLDNTSFRQDKDGNVISTEKTRKRDDEIGLITQANKKKIKLSGFFQLI